MKTVLISSFHTLISRNILATSFFSRLVETEGIRIVIVVPDFKVEYFTKRWGAPNVFVRSVRQYQASRTMRGLIFKRFSMLLFSTPTTRYKFRYKYYWDKDLIYYVLSVVVGFVGQSMIVRRWVRFFDYHLSPRDSFKLIFEEFNPTMVLATDIQNENDVSLMHDARRRKVPILGMLRSWDNPTQRILRVWPDKLLVGSDMLSTEVLQYYRFPREKIEIVGHPHYDAYLHGPRTPREEFLKRLGLDPQKKLIFFAPGGIKIIHHDDIDQYVIEVLGEIGENVLVRYQLGEDIPLVDFHAPKNLAVYKPGIRFSRGESELTEEDEVNLIDSLYHADIVVTGPTSICLDAALLDKPVIAADCYPTARNKYEKVWGYPLAHIRKLLDTGGVRYVDAKEELLAAVREYLKNPRKDTEGRSKIRSYWFCYADGRSSDRLYQSVGNFLKHYGR